MKHSIPAVLVGSTFLLLALPIGAQIAPASDDAWDDSQGNVVTVNSATLYSDIRNMFGFVNPGSVEPGQVIFVDGLPPGSLHFVEWKMPAPTTITGILLAIAHDYGFDANRRGISEFSLYARNTGTSQFDLLVFRYFPANPYGDSIAPPGGLIRTNPSNNELYLCVRFEPVTAQEFRAEFVQFGEGYYTGPRIMELDGFVEDVPGCFDTLFASGFETDE